MKRKHFKIYLIINISLKTNSDFIILLNLLDVNTFQLNLYSYIKIYYVIFCVPVSPAGMVHNIKHSGFLQ